MRMHPSPPVLVCLIALARVDAAVAFTPERDAFAPAIAPELLVLARLGGAGDQRFIAVQAKGGTVQAVDGCGLGMQATIAADGTPAVRKTGNPAQPSTRDARDLLANGGQVGAVSFGYTQVAGNLQQPWAKGPGWQLWGFTYEQAKSHELMADSRIRAGLPMPNGDVLLIGWCDGGNTVLHRDPRDIAKRSPAMRYVHGGGRGSSLLFSQVTMQGEVLRQAFLGPGCGGVTWDPWGRLYTCGTNLCKGGKAPFNVESSGSLLVFDRAWTAPIIDARLGGAGASYKDNMWEAIALDAEHGLLALAGWTTGAIAKQVNGVQEADGGGKDAMLAVIRLWTPDAYKAAVAAERGPAKK